MSDQFTEQLSPYLDGELDDLRRVRLEAHLAGCADCDPVGRAVGLLVLFQLVVAKLVEALDDAGGGKVLLDDRARAFGCVGQPCQDEVDDVRLEADGRFQLHRREKKSAVTGDRNYLFGRAHNGSSNGPRQRHAQSLLAIRNEDLPRFKTVEMACQP